MLTNWYPTGAPAWPPPGVGRLEFKSISDIEAWVRLVKSQGIADIDNPTNQERNNYFNPARCNEGHTVTGRMLVMGGQRYPFCVCDNQQHREFLVAWSPFFWGALR